MLEYFYTLNYTTNYPDAYVRIDIHTRMYAIADRYEIKALKTIAAMNFQSEFPHAVEQAAWRSELPQEIVSIADTVYTTTPDSIQPCAVLLRLVFGRRCASYRFHRTSRRCWRRSRIWRLIWSWRHLACRNLRSVKIWRNGE
jgi:anti-sigma-K factor RskA